jgi:hypothetical protein
MLSDDDIRMISETISKVRESYGTNWDLNLFRCCDDVSRAFASAIAKDYSGFDRDAFLERCGFGTKGE